MLTFPPTVCFINNGAMIILYVSSCIHIIEFFSIHMKWSEAAQPCPTLCDPMDCSLQGSSVHGIFQARVLEWVAISFSMYTYGIYLKAERAHSCRFSIRTRYCQIVLWRGCRTAIPPNTDNMEFPFLTWYYQTFLFFQLNNMK